jgi:hypothetical protein
MPDNQDYAVILTKYDFENNSAGLKNPQHFIPEAYRFVKAISAIKSLCFFDSVVLEDCFVVLVAKPFVRSFLTNLKNYKPWLN